MKNHSSDLHIEMQKEYVTSTLAGFEGLHTESVASESSEDLLAPKADRVAAEEEQENCMLCEEPLLQENFLDKVCDHCDITGKYHCAYVQTRRRCQLSFTTYEAMTDI